MPDIATYAGEIAASIMALAVAVDKYGPSVKRKLNGKTIPPPSPISERPCADVPRLYTKANDADQRITRCESDTINIKGAIDRVEERQEKLGTSQVDMHRDIGILLDRTKS